MAAVMVMAMVVAVEEAMAMVVVMGNGCGGSGRNRDLKIATKATPRGFEPLRAEPNGFLVPLGHSVNISFGLPKTKHLRRKACWDRGDLGSGGKQSRFSSHLRKAFVL